MGLLCLKLLVAEGVRTIVAGTSGDVARLDAARRFGAAEVVNIHSRNLMDSIREYTGGAGVDVAFECAGNANSVRGCLESLRPMGQYTQVAICGQDIQFPIDQIFYKQLRLVGSVCYTARTWERVMKIYAEGRIRLKDLISDKLPISDWRYAFDLCAEKRALKVLMYPEA
jgi:L-iditol 2-dehydrogenase